MTPAQTPGLLSARPRQARASGQKLRWAAVAGAGTVATAYVGLVDPARHALFLPCPFKLVTGLNCPLCGATRATHQLLHGHLGAAVHDNALYVSALPVVVFVGLMWLVGGRKPALLESRAVAFTALGIALAWGVIRNLPFAPFHSLLS